MKVKELIEKLMLHDPESQVIVPMAIDSTPVLATTVWEVIVPYYDVNMHYIIPTKPVVQII